MAEREFYPIEYTGVWYERDITIENLLTYFNVHEAIPAWIVDEKDQFIGMISERDVSINSGELKFHINYNCMVATYENRQEDGEKYSNVRYLPVITNEKKIIGFYVIEKINNTERKEIVLSDNGLRKFVKKTAQTDVRVIIADGELNDREIGLLSNLGLQVQYKSLSEINSEDSDERTILLDVSNASGRYYRWLLAANSGFGNIYDCDTFIEALQLLIRWYDCLDGRFTINRLLKIINNTELILRKNTLISAKMCCCQINFISDLSVSACIDSDVVFDLQLYGERNFHRYSYEGFLWFIEVERISDKINEECQEKNIRIININAPFKKKLTEGEQKRFAVQKGLLELSKQEENNLIYCIRGVPWKREDIRNIPINIQYISCGCSYRIIPFQGSDILIQDGLRKNIYNAEQYCKTLWLIGVCIGFSLYEEDKYCIHNYLQLIFNEHNIPIRVVCLNVNDIRVNMDLIQYAAIEKGDIIVNFTHILSDDINYHILDSSKAFVGLENEDIFLDYPGHMMAKGNKLMAEYVFYQVCNEFNIADLSLPLKKQSRKPIWKQDSDYDFEVYINNIKRQINWSNRKQYGAIVMNCNPMTLGHLYLIKYALTCCDNLIIFIVQENKSEVKFEDRMNIVKQELKNYEKVHVIPSGKYIISGVTFPSYFNKEAINKRPQRTIISVDYDLETFAFRVAPQLHIVKRFVGEEPTDAVTAKYNERMRFILPQCGIEVIEIPRKEIEGVVVSAKLVRRLAQEKRWEELKSLVPRSTMLYYKDDKE